MTQSDYLLFKTIFDQTPVSTQIFTPDGETVMVNKAWEDLWKISFSRLKRYNILQDKQLDEAGIMPLIKKGLRGETVLLPALQYIPAKTVNIKHTVAYRWVQAKMYPIKGIDGSVTHVVLQHEDITEKRDVEEIKNRLAAIVESSDDVIVSKNLDGIIASWNKAAEKLFGYSAKEVIGKHISLIIPEELRSQEEEIIRNLKQGKHIDHFETERVGKHGKRVYVSLSISPIKDASGVIVGASKIARDISAKKQYEEALRASEERLRLALKAGKIGVWDWNITGGLLEWSENVYRIHGVTKKSFNVTLDSFYTFIHPEDKEKVQHSIDATIKDKKPFSLEFRIITPKGETRWVSTSAMFWTDEQNNVYRILGATTDITLQKKLEQDKNDFVSMASHELKTPLTSMKLYIDLLKLQIERGLYTKSGEYINRIQDQANRLTELTGDLLDVSRIETGKMRLKKEKFIIDTLVEDTIESIQLTTNLHEIQLIKKNKTYVFADRYRIYQVIVNLLTNAIKYSPKGKILVNVTSSKDEVTISVQDFGIGITKENLKKVFEKLYQISEPNGKTYPGLGLGLYISKEIIDRHKGKIWVESIRGKGTTFFISLPKSSSN